MVAHLHKNIHFLVSRYFPFPRYPFTKWHRAAFYRHCRRDYNPLAEPTRTNCSQGFLFSPDGVRVGSLVSTKPAYFRADYFWKICWRQHVKSRAVKLCLLCVNWVFHSVSQLSGEDRHPPYAPRLLPRAPSEQLQTSPDSSQHYFEYTLPCQEILILRALCYASKQYTETLVLGQSTACTFFNL